MTLMTDEALIEEACALYDLATDANLNITTAINLMAGRLRVLTNSPLPSDTLLDKALDGMTVPAAGSPSPVPSEMPHREGTFQEAYSK